MRVERIRYGLLFLLFLFLARFILAAGSENTAGTAGDLRNEEISALLLRLGRNVSTFINLKTDFIQEKKLALFKNKIVIKGRICIKKPGKIAWHVDQPVRYTVVLSEQSIKQWDEESNQIQEISLSGNPMLKNVLDQLSVWFSGDYNSLLKDNSARILGKAPLAIEFLPKETSIAKSIIKRIIVTFREDEKYLSKVVIQEVSGDITTIVFMNTVFDAPVGKDDFEVKPSA